ncbi:hypothetical protein [Tellurirhabdus rosea]|uniref:hypothetical protein n=1 Tax=Tellurirhabdus rosea TaxID=2674997 RepID=UPI0022578EE5|nr:hypothetical protein [Tellurirhabdus rosea]
MKKWMAGLWLTGLGICPAAFAQQVQEGYAVTSQGDTLRGQIEYGDWKVSPSKISFKPAGKSEFSTYSVNELTSFYISAANELYVTRQARLTRMSTGAYQLGPQEKDRFSVTVFMQVVLAGKGAALYRMKDMFDKTHFFVEKNGDFAELVYQRFLRVRGERTYIVADDSYRQQLQTLCSDAPTFRATAPEYTESSLKKYLLAYNRCFSAETITYESKAPRHLFDLSVSAGVETNVRLLISEPAARRVYPSYGLGLRVSLPRHFHNQFLRFNASITPNIRFNYDYGTYEQGGRSSLQIVEFSGGSYFGKGALRPYVYLSGTLFNFYHATGALLFINGGLSYRRKLDLDLGHLLQMPLNKLLNREMTLVPGPRVSLHYYLNPFAKKQK